MSKFAIEVSGVSKYFNPSKGQRSIKQVFTSFFSKQKRSKAHGYWAVKNINFKVEKGEFFGIVGRNGSGKSTLLKMIAGVYEPTDGAISVDGKLVPFIELGVGFNPELTGRDNVYLNGALLGFTRSEMTEMYEDIVEFAELSQHMDIKLKNFSSGMQVRLAFSIAIRAKSDILLVDEVLAVGDSAFQKKCFEIFTALKKEGRTIVFITHDMGAVERFCDRVLVLDKKKSRGIYLPHEASVIYDQLNAESNPLDDDASSDGEPVKKIKSRWGTGDIKIKSITLHSNGKPASDNIIQMGDSLSMTFKFNSKSTKKYVLGLSFEDAFGVNVAGPNSIGVDLTSDKDVTYTIDKVPFVPGDYKVTVAIFDEDLINEYDHLDRTIKLTITGKTHMVFGKINLFGSWDSES